MDDFSDANMDLLFEGDRMYLHNASGRFGAVPLALTGSLFFVCQLWCAAHCSRMAIRAFCSGDTARRHASFFICMRSGTPWRVLALKPCAPGGLAGRMATRTCEFSNACDTSAASRRVAEFGTPVGRL